LEVATEKIRVNAVSPAGIETDMLNRFIDNDQEKKSEFAKMHPMNRVGTPDEIADAVLFLCSDYSTFTTGQSLTIDGGYTAT
jgi:NAD(P)-dependent dehydrogenase (short-subunit alcohol dehydrogenase family)